MLEVKNLASLVNFQEGVVASRTLVNKQTGTVTIFAFDKEQGLSEHNAPFDAMVYIVEGRANITISNTVYTLEEGETIIMPANEPHKVDGIEKFKMLLIMIKDKT